MTDFALQLAVPIILTSDMSASDFAAEFRAMRLREMATQEFCDGTMDAGEWLDILDECGVEVESAVKDWGDGISYLRMSR